MSRILIYSTNKTLIKLWSSALSLSHQVVIVNEINNTINADAIIIDIRKIDSTQNLSSLFSQRAIKYLLVGENWPESKQVDALVHGAAGYCEELEPPELLLQAIKSILKGDIWIQRHLVPKVIGTLVKMKSSPSTKKVHPNLATSKKLLNSLSVRELDVANMIRSGENNKNIATSLHISERTVKAHLTSIFRKLNVDDRLHLALFIKEFD